MAWKSAPTRGHIAGAVTTNTGIPLDQILVELRDPETDAVLASRFTDGTGYFGFVDLVPGRYKVFVPDAAPVTGKRVAVINVAAGAVARVGAPPFAQWDEGNGPPKARTPTFRPVDAPATL